MAEWEMLDVGQVLDARDWLAKKLIDTGKVFGDITAANLMAEKLMRTDPIDVSKIVAEIRKSQT